MSQLERHKRFIATFMLTKADRPSPGLGGPEGGGRKAYRWRRVILTRIDDCREAPREARASVGGQDDLNQILEARQGLGDLSGGFS